MSSSSSENMRILKVKHVAVLSKLFDRVVNVEETVHRKRKK